MLKLSEKKMLMPRHLLAGQRVSRKYRLACIRRTEYRRLKAIVPSIANKQKVSKVKVVEEAIKYIDELHRALFSRAPFLVGHLGNASAAAPAVDDSLQLVARLLAPTGTTAAADSSTTSDRPPRVGSSGSSSLPMLPPAVATKRSSTISCGALRPLQSSNYLNIIAKPSS